MSKEVLPNHCQMIMVAEREKVDRLVRRQHTRRCPLPSYRYGRRREAYTQNYSSEEITLMRSKSAFGNVGQQAKDSALPYYSQAHKMTSVLK